MMNTWVPGLLLVPAAVVLIASVNSEPSKSSKPSEPVVTGCKTDWTVCSDGDDLAAHWKGFTKMQVACRMATDKLPKWGDGKVEWPWLPFSAYVGDFKDGKITLSESRAKFTNAPAFGGTKVVARAQCNYDLNKESVIYVMVAGPGIALLSQ